MSASVSVIVDAGLWEEFAVGDSCLPSRWVPDSDELTDEEEPRLAALAAPLECIVRNDRVGVPLFGVWPSPPSVSVRPPELNMCVKLAPLPWLWDATLAGDAARAAWLLWICTVTAAARFSTCARRLRAELLL